MTKVLGLTTEQKERAIRFLAKGTTSTLESWLEEFFAMLALPDTYECCWHDGEIYLRPVVEGPETVPMPGQARELEPA